MYIIFVGCQTKVKKITNEHGFKYIQERKKKRLGVLEKKLFIIVFVFVSGYIHMYLNKNEFSVELILYKLRVKSQ